MLGIWFSAMHSLHQLAAKQHASQHVLPPLPAGVPATSHPVEVMTIPVEAAVVVVVAGITAVVVVVVALQRAQGRMQVRVLSTQLNPILAAPSLTSMCCNGGLHKWSTGDWQVAFKSLSAAWHLVYHMPCTGLESSAHSVACPCHQTDALSSTASLVQFLK